MFVDEYTKYKWSNFVERKSDFTPIVISRLRELIYLNFKPKYIRLDNSGENIKLKNDLITNMNYPDIRNIKIEFTAPHTPQQNGVVERSFSYFYDKVRAMLNRAGFPLHLRELFWAECCNMVTQIDNILVKNKYCNYELLFKRKPKVWRELHGFGEICVYSNLSKLSSKINNKGELSMMVGFSYNHPHLTFRLFKFITKSIIHSRDVKWLNKYYSEYFNSDKINTN